MATMLSAVVVGLLVLLVFKLFSYVVGYYRMCVKLRKIPQLPSHWLYGNLDRIRDSTTYVDTIKEFVNTKGIRMYCIWIGPFPVVGVTHPDTVKEIIRQESRKAKSIGDGYRYMIPWLGDGLLISQEKKWERNRKLLTPAFHFDILKGYVSSMNKAAGIYLNKLEKARQGGKSVDIFPFTCKLTLDVMFRSSLSYEQADSIQNEEDVPYIKAVRRLSEMMWLRMLHPQYMFDWIYNWTALKREHDRLTDFVHKFTGNIIQSRREKLENGANASNTRRHLDFLDILLTAKDGQGHGLSNQEIQDEVDTFTFEGHDTTASTISWCIYALGKYPDIQNKVYEDVTAVLGDRTDVQFEDISKFEYLSLFIKETLRIYNTVPMVARKHTSPIVLDDVEIPVGPRVDINITALHLNKNMWQNVEVFDPDRFSVHNEDKNAYGYIPFSAGSRNCIGQHFALNEVKTTIAKFVKRFRVSVEGLKEPVLLPEVILKSSCGIHVNLTPR